MTILPDTKSQKETGEKLREIRERKGLSQEEVAKASGMSASYYARIERGEENFTNSYIRAICKALNIKLSEVTK